MRTSFLALSLPLLVALPGVASGESTLMGSQPGAKSKLYALDRSTGAGTEIGFYVPSVESMNGLAYDAVHDVMYGISPARDRLYRICPTTADVTPIGSSGDLGFGNANGLAYDPVHEVLYGSDNTTNSLFTIDTTTGRGCLVAQIGGGFSNVEGLGFDSRTGTLYGLADGRDGEEVFYYGQIVVIDPATAYATALGDELPSERIWRGLTFDPETGGLIACGGSGLYRIDVSTGAATFIGGVYVQGLAVIPEPATLALLAVGAVGMWLRHRKQA